MTTEDEIIIRSPLPGELGWIIQVHGQYYAEKNGWYGEFECIVAKIVVDYLSAGSCDRQACFIAELNGQRVGCIMLTESSHSEGKLRVMFVSADDRGKGIGTLLIKAVFIENKSDLSGFVNRCPSMVTFKPGTPNLEPISFCRYHILNRE